MDYEYDRRRLFVTEEDGLWKIKLVDSRGNACRIVSDLYETEEEAQLALDARAEHLCLKQWDYSSVKPNTKEKIAQVMMKARLIA